MKNKLLLIAIAVTAGSLGCNKNSSKPITPTQQAIQVRTLSTVNVSLRVKELVKNDDVIDVDVAKISDPSAKLSDEDYAKVRASIYRFYKNVKLQDGQYVYYGSTNPDTVKLSSRLLKAFTKNLNDMNNEIEKAKAKGKTIDLPPIDNHYLNSLLQ
jgi:predicted HTH transcriptional regulator